MYLAKLQNRANTTYQIRQSYKGSNNLFRYKILFDLGKDPSQFFEIFEHHIVLFDNHLVDTISSCIGADCEHLLESLLFPFFPREVQENLSAFTNYGNLSTPPLTSQEEQEIHRQIHLFDKKRLYYIRYGAIDQSRLFRLHIKCCKPLLGQSRDEREFYFSQEETSLSPSSFRKYLYAIFNIQKHFNQSYASWLPEALAQDEVSDYFVEELCKLNNDPSFWQSGKIPQTLHHHLIRYVIMFFDYEPEVRMFSEDFVKSFMSDRRQFHWPSKNTEATPERVEELFGTSTHELKKMTKVQLNRLYRQKAMVLHPDQGGDHELFIELSEIYKQLLIKITSKS